MDLTPRGAPPATASGDRTALTVLSTIAALVGLIAAVAAGNGSAGVAVGGLILGAGAFGLGWASVPRRRAEYPQAAAFAQPPPPPAAVAAPPVWTPAPPGAPAPPPAPWTPSPAPVVAPPAATRAPRPPRPSVRQIVSRFVSTHAILLLSYLGAFLLIVSALLFLLYGPQDLPGGVRLATVAGVNAILAAAAVGCRRRTSLHLVATSYTALAALLTPVTFAAAYEFVLRYATPLNGITAVAIAAAACALLYGLLARALTSRSYASLSVVALATSGVAGAVAAGTGPVLLPAVAVYTALCWWMVRTKQEAFALPAAVAGHAAAAGAVGAAIGFAAYNGFSGAAPFAAYLPGTLAAVAAAYGLKQWLHGDDAAQINPIPLISAAVVTASQTLGYGADGAAAALVLVGVVTASLTRMSLRARVLYGRRLSGDRYRLGLALLAAAELAATGLCPIARPLLQVILLPLAVAASAVLVRGTRYAAALAIGLAVLVAQIAVQANEQTLLPVAPAYIAATLITMTTAAAALAARYRDVWLLLSSMLLFISATLAGGSTLSWHGNEFAIALIASAGVITAAAQPLGAPLRGMHASLARSGVGPALGWIGAATAIGAALSPVTNPALQVAILGAAAACGLAFALRFRSPVWLATGLGALAVQAIVSAASITGSAPAFVPATLGVVLAACIVDGAVRRDSRMALPSSALLIVATLTAGSTLRWAPDLYAFAMSGVALVCTASAVLLPTRLPLNVGRLWRGLHNAGAWIAVAAMLTAGAFTTTVPATPFAVLSVAALAGLALALGTRSSWWLLAGVLVVLIDASVHAPAVAAAGALPAYVPAGLGAVLLSVLVAGIVWRDRALIVPANLCLTAVALTANSTLSLGTTGYAVELVVLAYMTIAMALIAGNRRVSMLLQAGAGARLVIAAAVIMPSAWGEAALVGAATLAAASLAAASRRGQWTYLAGALLAWAWSWGATAAGTTADPPSALNAFSALPFVYLAIAVVLARAVPRHTTWAWALAPCAFGVTATAVIDALAISAHVWTLLAWSLAVDGVLVYVFARTSRRSWMVPVAAGCLSGSTIALLAAIDAPLVAYPLAIAGVAWVVRGLGAIAGSAVRGRAWSGVHRWSALGVATLAVAAPVANGVFAAERSAATLSELAASLSLAVLVAAGITSNSVRDRCVAAVAVSLALEWLPVFFGVHEAQAYVALPAVVLAACGVLALHDRRVGVDRLGAYITVGVGAGTALLTTLVQMAGSGEASIYTAWLLLEGIACVGVAIALRVRLLAVIGGAAVAAAALRALITAVESVPLYAVFGVAALALMVLATVLATQRARLHDARESVREAWSTWD